MSKKYFYVEKRGMTIKSVRNKMKNRNIVIDDIRLLGKSAFKQKTISRKSEMNEYMVKYHKR